MTTWDFGIAVTCESRIAAMCKPGTAINPVIVAYQIFGVAMTMCVSRGAVMCKVRTVMPRIRAITPMKPRETARAAATALPIESRAEDRSFTSSRRELNMKSHSQLTIGAALIAGFVSLSFVPAFAQHTAKVCEEQWKSGKASFQSSGKKKKDFMAECRGLSPTATAPAKTVPTSTGSNASAKACEEQWKANKPAIHASGKTKKVFISECRTGPTIAAAPAKPGPASAAPSNEWRTPARPTTTPTTAGTPAGANQYSTEGAARLRCPLDTVVWVNLKSSIYHFNGKKDYGTTRSGSYMCEKDTGTAGFRVAKNEKHP